MPEPRARGRAAATRLLQASLAIESNDARSAGALGFMARTLVQIGLPHRELAEDRFLRRNGDLSVCITGHPDIGLPYGRYPRLLLIWITGEAIRTRSPLLRLGPTLSRFMIELGLIPAGGRFGTIGRLRDQMKRLFCSTIACTYDGAGTGEWHDLGFRVAEETHLWWQPPNPGQFAAWRSTVELSAGFFNSIVDRPVPIDLRVVKALRSPMALDIYTWLTYRMSYLRKPTRITWQALRFQFGAQYSRARDFKESFLRHTQTVLALYPAARLEPRSSGLVLKPSPPHIPKTNQG